MAKYEEMLKNHFNRTASTYESGCEGRLARSHITSCDLSEGIPQGYNP